jgi:predicted RNA-binding Zn ribbon-like protein
MEASRYRIDGARAAAALVNAATAGGDLTDAGVSDLLRAHHYLAPELSLAEADRVRDWAHRLRPAFGGADAATLLNELLAEVALQPYIGDHGMGPHLHYGDPGAGLVDRVRADTAFGLALVVCEHGADRLGRCDAGGCDRVYADVQRGPRRGYCSRACQNRSSMVMFRAKRARHTTGSTTAT